MKQDVKRALLFGALAFLFSFLAAFLFFNTGLSSAELLSFSFSGKIAKVLSVNFLLFVLSVPLLGGLAGAASFWLERKIAWVVFGIGSALGLGLAALLFSGLLDFLWVGVFFVLGLLWAIQQVYMKKDELKHWVSFRLPRVAVQRHLALVSVGLLVFSAATILPQKEAFAEQFETDLVNKVFSGNSIGNLKSQVAASMAKNTVESQRQLIGQITLWPQYSSFRSDLQNQNTQEFVAAMGQLQSTIESDAYRQTIQTQIEQQTAGATVNPQDLFNKVKTNFPLFNLLGDWLWLIFGMGLASVLLFFSSFVFGPLGMLYGAIFHAIFKIAWPATVVSPEPMKVPAASSGPGAANSPEIQKLKAELKKQLEENRSV